jgi:NAD(P)-dependent dehydrogenase (short-subunit alcohol dehydrogenase family)
MSLNVIITGASSGIGAALARDLAAAGDKVYACARHLDALEQLASGYAGIAVRSCDVADEGQVVQFMEWVARQTRSVDALLNCAGVLSPIGQIASTDSEEWFHTLRINLFGTYVMIKHAIPLLEGSPSARIINFAGGGAFNPFPNYSAYACSKAGVVRLTECLAQELAGRRISVNAIAPGFVATPIHLATLQAGSNRAGQEQYDVTRKGLQAGLSPKAAVECVRFLLSAAATGLTGKAISANFDPWREPAFSTHISEINRSDLLTLRRVAPWSGTNVTLSQIMDKLQTLKPSTAASDETSADDREDSEL